MKPRYVSHLTSSRTSIFLASAAALLMLFPGSGCAKKSDDPAPAPGECSELVGTAWTPNVAGVSSSNHDSNVTVTKEILTATGPITGLGQAAPSARELSVTINMSEDLGEYGSLTLLADVEGFPADLKGSAYPLLVSLHDGTNELINLARVGTGTDCAASGYYTCTGASCSANPACSISSPSAYTSRDVWETHQIPDFGYTSVNTFPTCNYSETAGANSPACAFTDTFFTGTPKRLRSGVNYTAKFVLLASSYKTITGYTATLKVTAIKKKDASATMGGAMDINVVIVGNKNINASRTDKGKQNLDLLFTGVRSIYEQASIKIGSINAYEWDCKSGGDAYTSTADNMLGNLFKEGSARVSSATEGKAINIFFISEIPYSTSPDSNLTIAGSSSMILGPMTNGNYASGVAVASFDKLDVYNPSCTGGDASACPAASQEREFEDMKRTIAHEAGHYLGLFHPSESGGTVHDPIYDTPVCTAKQTIGSNSYITINSCLNVDTTQNPPGGQTCNAACGSYSSTDGVFCPEVAQCQFNHVMWWTSQNYKNGKGDGTIFSPYTRKILNYSPFVQ